MSLAQDGHTLADEGTGGKAGGRREGAVRREEKVSCEE